MKKTIALFCPFLLVLALGACGQEEISQSAEETSSQAETSSESVDLSEASTESQSVNSAETSTVSESLNLPETADTAEIETQAAAETMQISVLANGNTVVFELNDNQAARDLYEQLPLTTEVENYSTNEKIFYPPVELDVSDAPQAEAGAGTLAYYAPWGDVIMFYGDFGSASGLYELGQVVSGSEYISEMTGSIQIQQTSES